MAQLCKALQTVKVPRRFYGRPHIADAKLEAALDSYAQEFEGQPARVALLYDSTLLGGARHGFVV